MNARMSAKHVAAFLEMTYTTLCYWVQTDLLHVDGGGQRGAKWKFTGADVMRALTVKELKAKGANLRAIRAAVESLERLHDINEWHHEWLAVTPDGKVVWLAARRGRVVWLDDAFDVVDPVSGQVYLIDVGGMKARVRDEFEAIERLHAKEAAVH